jgi:DNA-binding MarR family transcriptional regulator
VADDDAEVLGELLLRVARTQRRRWRDALAPWDLSPHQARALGVVCAGEGTRLSDLAEALHIAPRSATEVADALEARGLAVRSPDPTDRRAVVVTPTAAGRRVAQEVTEARAADTRDLFARLDPDQRAGLARILRALVAE